jgi:hypothetical protein
MELGALAGRFVAELVVTAPTRERNGSATRRRTIQKRIGY